jgi:hypothetical protein
MGFLNACVSIVGVCLVNKGEAQGWKDDHPALVLSSQSAALIMS